MLIALARVPTIIHPIQQLHFLSCLKRFVQLLRLPPATLLQHSVVLVVSVDLVVSEGLDNRISRTSRTSRINRRKRQRRRQKLS